MNENSPTLNLPHVEFPSAEQEDAEMELVLPQELHVFSVFIILFNSIEYVTE